MCIALVHLESGRAVGTFSSKRSLLAEMLSDICFLPNFQEIRVLANANSYFVVCGDEPDSCILGFPVLGPVTKKIVFSKHKNLPRI